MRRSFATQLENHEPSDHLSPRGKRIRPWFPRAVNGDNFTKQNCEEAMPSCPNRWRQRQPSNPIRKSNG
jgi:hypothetical protein